MIFFGNHPWTTSSYLALASKLNPQPATVVSNDVFQPSIVRIGVHGCVDIDNEDDATYSLSLPAGAPKLGPHQQMRYCFASSGYKRIQLNHVPYSGGWVLVDPSDPT